MPAGSERKLIAEQAGAAFPGALVAASAGKPAKASAKPIATMIIVCIVLSPQSPKALGLYPGRFPGSRVNAMGADPVAARRGSNPLCFRGRSRGMCERDG